MFYDKSERQEELAALRGWLTEQARGRTILEIAAGTGYWTEVAATVAKSVTATDYNPEMLAIAARRVSGEHVALNVADAYCLPSFDVVFDCGMAHMWWSHVEKQRQDQFLGHFCSRLGAGARILMIDQTYVEGLTSPIHREDASGNLYALRRLINGATYEIIKNYPSSDELRDTFARCCEDVEVVRLTHFWALSARVGAQ